MAFTLVLDPGHGGDNLGTCHGLLIEKEWTLAMCLRLRDTLLAKDYELAVHLTRWRDEEVSLEQRGRIAEKLDAHLSLSIHVNSNKDSRVSGLMCYRRFGDDLGAEVAHKISKEHPVPGYWVDSRGDIRERLKGDLVARDHQWHHTYRAYNVLSKYEKKSAVLVECGFASNKEDREFMLSDTGRNTIEDSISSGVKKAVDLWRELYDYT